MPAFSRFLEAVGYSHGELINFANIARDSGVDARTVREYYQILVDTLFGRFVEPYSRRSSRQVITRAPKFYLFDVGVTGATWIEGSTSPAASSSDELSSTSSSWSSLPTLPTPNSITRLDSGEQSPAGGRLRLGDGEVTIEVKGSNRVDRIDLRGLEAFSEGHKPRHQLLVCTEKRERLTENGIRIKPWRRFLEELWSGEIIK